MKLTVLVDNNTNIDQYYHGEPGLSFYIEVDNARILFDLGYSNIFKKNADKMDIDLSNLTHIVLSHGHDDHTRGLCYLPTNHLDRTIKLVAHPDCLLPKYMQDDFIGSPCGEEWVRQFTDYIPTIKPYKIARNLYFMGQIPRVTDFEAQDPIGYKIKNEKKIKDYLIDDSALLYRTKMGIFIITGCSHSGICNIIEHAKKLCGDERIIGVIGGFHLMGGKNDEKTEKTVDYFKANNVKKVYPCHCVSLFAQARFVQEFDVEQVGVGTTIII